VDEAGWLREVILPDSEFTLLRRTRKVPSWRTLSSGSRRKSDPHYVPPPRDVVRLEEVIVTTPTVSLGSALALPPQTQPVRAAALFIGGSGTHDRHGIGGGIDLGYHEVLDLLASFGVASLRFDKRGAGRTKLGKDTRDASFGQVVGDASCALAFRRAHPETRGVPTILIGHSEGGLVALELAVVNTDIAGVAVLSTAGRSIDKVLADQLMQFAREANVGASTLQRWIKNQDAFFRAVRQVPVWTPDTVSASIFAQRHQQTWYSELLARDPLNFVSQLQCQLLILQGDHDVQVSVGDSELLAEAAQGNGVVVEHHVLKRLDHLLKRVGKRSANRAEYDRRRVSTAVAGLLIRWIEGLENVRSRSCKCLSGSTY